MCLSLLSARMNIDLIKGKYSLHLSTEVFRNPIRLKLDRVRNQLISTRSSSKLKMYTSLVLVL